MPEDTKDELLFLKVSEVGKIIPALDAINSGQPATFCITSDGIKVTVQEPGQFQATAYLSKVTFDEYKLIEPRLLVVVDLRVVMTVLQMFRDAGDVSEAVIRITRMRPLYLLLDVRIPSSEYQVQSEIRGSGCEGLMEELTCGPQFIGIICGTSLIANAFEWNQHSGYLEFAIQFTPDMFVLSTFRGAIECEVTITKDSSHVRGFVPGGCRRVYRYMLGLENPIHKALMKADMVSIRVNEEGLLFMEVPVHCEDGMTSLVVILCYEQSDAGADLMDVG